MICFPDQLAGSMPSFQKGWPQIEQLYRELFAQTEARHKVEIEKISEHVAKTEARHKSQVEELTTHLAQTEEQLKQRDAAIAELETRRTQTEEQLKQRDAAIAELETRRTQTEEQLISENSRRAELTDRLLKLNQEVKSCIEVFGLTRQGLQNSDSAAAVLIPSLFHDIRLIRKRKSLWKACRLLRSMLCRECNTGYSD